MWVVWDGGVVVVWFGLDGVVLWEVYPDLEIYIYTQTYLFACPTGFDR